MFYCLIAVIAVCFLAALHRLQFDRRSVALFAISLLLMLSCFLNQEQWKRFSADYAVHEEYTLYVAAHGALPPVSLNAGTRHPPTYYALAAGFVTLGQWAGDRADIMDYARLTSLALMCMFWVFAALAMRRLFVPGSTAYWCALLLLAFWPGGLYKANVLNCDVMTYPALMAFIYTMIAWLQTRRAAWLEGACYAVAVHLLAKNSGMVPLVFLGGAFILNHVGFKNRLRATFRPRMLLALAFLALCCTSTLLRDQLQHVTTPDLAAYSYSWDKRFDLLVYFSPYQFIAETMYAPYGEFSLPHFWHFYLRSLLVGGSIGWEPHVMLVVFGLVWLVMIAYILHGMWCMRREPVGQGVWLCMTLLSGALTLMLMSRFYGSSQPNLFADARYVYPVIAIIIAYYCRTIDWHERQGHKLLAQSGSGLVLGFVLLTFLLVTLQNLG